MQWALTGGSGQLGRSLARALDDRGFSYVSWSKKDLDITEKSATKVIEQANPQVLINCAAWTNVDGAEDDFEGALRANQIGAQNGAISAKE